MSVVTYPLLLGIKAFARTFYDIEVDWVGDAPDDPWGDDLRIIAILNHTSLFEPLFAGGVPNRLLEQIATRGAVPVAEKTIKRPIVGRFFRLVAPHVVPITRQRDRTWIEFAKSVAPGSLVIILPEGRMKRATGLDSKGNPMTVRGGIADLLRGTDDGRMLLAYSGGLHHVQVPGETIPRFFKTIRLRFESVDIDEYKATVVEATGKPDFKLAVIADLEARRDRYCPTEEKKRLAPTPATRRPTERRNP